jgi:amino acid transporter
MAALSMHVFSSEFLGAITSLAGTSDYPLKADPFFYLFVSMLTTNSVVIGIIAIAFVAGIVTVIVPTLMIATRNMFAWSLDRMAPMQLMDVSARNATPVKATIVSGVVMALCMVAYLYAPVKWTVYLFVPGVMGLITFAIVSATGAVFPYRRPEIYNASPHRWQVGPVPVITILGVIGFCYDLLLIYYFMTNEALGLTTTAAYVSVPVVFIVGLVWYLVASRWNARRGISTELAFAELPPE